MAGGWGSKSSHFSRSYHVYSAHFLLVCSKVGLFSDTSQIL